MKLVLDFETSTHNKGNPFDSRNKAVSYSYYSPDIPRWHARYTDLDFVMFLKHALSDTSLFISHNAKFDLHWCRKVLGTELPKFRVWDTQLAEFVLSGQRNSFASLNSLAEMYGLPTKLDAVAEYWEKGVATEDIPPDVLEEYNNYDVELTWTVYLKQQDDPRMTPELHKLIMLQGLDLLVLQEMEWNGLKYNVAASKAEAERLSEELATIDARLKSIAGDINFDSGDELSCFLFGGSVIRERCEEISSVYKSGEKKGQEYIRRRWLEPEVKALPGFFTPDKTKELKKSKGIPDAELTNNTRYYATGADILEQLKCRSKVQKQIVDDLKRRAYLQKLVSTYLEALPALLEEKHWGEYLHGQFNQVVARTGRLSSSNPNLQNNPGEVDRYIITRYAN
jgi:DNA polymerase I-like protein with 3'-5' exonuclease and polymerase domains